MPVIYRFTKVLQNAVEQRRDMSEMQRSTYKEWKDDEHGRRG